MKMKEQSVTYSALLNKYRRIAKVLHKTSPIAAKQYLDAADKRIKIELSTQDALNLV